MKRAGILALSTIAFLASSCLWLQGGAKEQSSLPDQKPGTRPRTVSDPEANETGVIEPARPQIDAGSIPDIIAPRWSKTIPELTVWTCGLRSVWFGIGGPLGFLEVTIAHRSVGGPESLVAALTAQLVADAPRDGGTRPSLRQRLEQMGGSLEVEVDIATTRFRTTIHGNRVRQALAEFADCLASVPTTVQRVDVYRDQLVRRYTKQWAAEPLDTAIDRINVVELRGLDEWLASLEDSTAVDVGVFHRHNYVLPRIAIALGNWAGSSQVADELIAEAFAPLMAGKEPAAPELPNVNPLPSGVYWSETADAPRIAIVLDLPPPYLPDAAASLVVTELLGGPGGTIERALRSVVPELGTVRRSVRGDGIRRFLQLDAAIDAELVGTAWEAVLGALRETARRQPGIQEVRAAAARAWVGLAQQLREPRGLRATATRAAFAGLPPSVIANSDGTPLSTRDNKPAWIATLDALAQPEGIDVGDALTSLSTRRPLLAVIGRPPAVVAEKPFYLAVTGGFVPDARREVVTAEAAQQEAAARGHLVRAVTAVTGSIPTVLVPGFQWTSITRSGRGPEVVDIEMFRIDGRFRRVRNVLASTVQTIISPDESIELCGNERRRPDPDEVASILAPLRRHPLMLLSDWSRGRARYRLVSTRVHDGRDVAVLERMEDGGEPLRMMVDAETGLVRVVTYHEDRPNGRVYVRDEWRDYRAIGSGTRAPHHRTTFFDDGQHGLVTRWMEFRAVAPADELLAPGGPLR